MLYFGSYKVSNYKNIKSIPDIKNQCITKNNGVVFVVSDTLFTNNNSEITQDFIKSAKIFIDKLERQIRVFKNVEAIVLNGNIFRSMFSISNAAAFDSSMWCYSFLKSICIVANSVEYGEKPVPIYYVRGNEDCYIAMQNITPDIRAFVKLCNAVIIGSTIFIHGHNNLPFKESLETDFNIDNANSRDAQKSEAELIYQQTGMNVVMSNTNLDVYGNKHFISTGCFEKTKGTVINLDGFSVSNLTCGL